MKSLGSVVYMSQVYMRTGSSEVRVSAVVYVRGCSRTAKIESPLARLSVFLHSNQMEVSVSFSES